MAGLQSLSPADAVRQHVLPLLDSVAARAQTLFDDVAKAASNPVASERVAAARTALVADISKLESMLVQLRMDKLPLVAAGEAGTKLDFNALIEKLKAQENDAVAVLAPVHVAASTAFNVLSTTT